MLQEKMLITGASGMVGSAVARRAVEEGYEVRALVRADSDRSLLEGLDIEYVEGDLADPIGLESALADVSVVVHTAAHQGDWGPAEKYRAINVVALEHLLTAAERAGSLRLWVHISSLGVYPARDHYGTDETVPPDLVGLDGYTRTKAEAEVVLKRHIDEYHLPAIILRPGFIYGPGERHAIPQLIKRLRGEGTIKMIGDGQKVLNNTYVGNLVDAIFLALENEAAIGETFNIRYERLVTRVEYIRTVADYLDAPMPGKIPFWLARTLVGPIETFARITGRQQAPVLTGARLKFMARNLDFSIAKAKRVLGYQPRVDFQEGIREALDWATGKAPSKGAGVRT